MFSFQWHVVFGVHLERSISQHFVDKKFSVSIDVAGGQTLCFGTHMRQYHRGETLFVLRMPRYD